MNKGILTLGFLVSLVTTTSCGAKTVKVKLNGTNHISFNKKEDKAEITKDYVVNAIPERGYWLYPENLVITSNGIELSDYKGTQYSFDEKTQCITVKKAGIMGDIEIKAAGQEKTIYINYVFSSSVYSGLDDKPIEWVFNSDYSLNGIKRKDSTSIDKSKITVNPTDVIYDLENHGKNVYTLNVKGNQLYTDVTFTFLD